MFGITVLMSSLDSVCLKILGPTETCIRHNMRSLFFSATYVLRVLLYNKYLTTYTRNASKNVRQSSHKVSITAVRFKPKLDRISNLQKNAII